MILKTRAILIIQILTFLFLCNLSWLEWRKNTEIHFLNVEQGSSVLLKSSSGNNFLIDTGKIFSSLDYLKKELKHNRNIDILFLSHFDADHIGEAEQILEHFNVNLIVLNDSWLNLEDNQTQKDLKKKLKKKIKNEDLKIIVAQKGLKFKSENFIFEILGPKIPNFEKDKNDNSLIIQIHYKNLDILYTADISGKIEEKINSSILKEIDLFSISHHGSKYSSSEKFLKKLQNKVAVGQSKKSVYGHPHPDVVKKLNQAKIFTLLTEERGAIVFSLKDNLISWKSQK